MNHAAYSEMTALTEMDLFCREHYFRTGEYMEKPSVEEIRQLLEMWGKLDHVMSQEDLNHMLRTGSTDELNSIFSRESLFFEEGKDVSILSANRYFKMKPHSHRYFEIECVLEGSAIHNPGEGQVYLKKGDIVLVPPHLPHITQPVDSSTVIDLEIRLSTFETVFQDILSGSFPISSYFKNALYGKGRRDCIILDSSLDETALDLLGILWLESGNESVISGKKSVHLAEALLYHFAEIVTEEHIFDICEYQNEEMYQIRRYMLEHMDTVTLSELGRQFHRSDSVISRYIKTHSGKRFSELLQNMRLERAAGLLTETGQDIAGIAYTVGYMAESHFISCFRKKYGLTPLQYRRAKTVGK